MVNFPRRIKDSWTEHELMAYNISIAEQDQQTFFDGPLPDYTGPPGFSQSEDATDNLDHASRKLILYLNRATENVAGENSRLVNFIWILLMEMRYNERKHEVVTKRMMLPLNICGEEVYFETDIALMDCKTHIVKLVAQEDKAHINLATDPQAQLVALAIAAFQSNNAERVNNLSLPALESDIIPGFTLIRTLPRFYKIHVTSTLDHCVREGQCPTFKTTVYRHTPRIQEPSYDSMKPLANRTLILALFEGFKNLIHWE